MRHVTKTYNACVIKFKRRVFQSTWIPVPNNIINYGSHIYSSKNKINWNFPSSHSDMRPYVLIITTSVITWNLSQVRGTPFVADHLAVARFPSGQHGQSIEPPGSDSHTYIQTSSKALSERKQYIYIMDNYNHKFTIMERFYNHC